MNAVNTERMDSCEAGKVPFAEQLLSLILFHQDQNRLVRENCREYMNTDYRTGMELSVPRKPVTHYKNVKNSISDHFETFLEDINQIVNYLYYQFGRSFPERIKIADLQVEQIHPYENEKFEQYLYIALQRAMLCRLEEEYYLDCKVKEIEVRDMILTYKFLRTISEILYVASKKCIDEEKRLMEKK